MICNDKVVWGRFFVYIQSDMMKSCLWNFRVNESFYITPYSFSVFFIGFKICFDIFFAKTNQSYYLISVVLNFWWRIFLPVELVAWKYCLYSLFFTLMDLRMPDVIHGFEASSLILLFWVDNGEILLYRNFIFWRNNSKDKSVFFYIFLHSYPSLYFQILPGNIFC